MNTSGVSVDFSELKELNPFFDNQEKIMNTTVLNSFMKGAALAKKEFKKSTPSRLSKFNETIAVKKQKPKNGILEVVVGYFGRKLFYVNARGVKWDAFFLLYWSNYGTMAKRASDHSFQYGRRKISSAMKGGIQPVKFFDKTADLVMSPAFNEIDSSVEKELNKQVAKYGFK